MLEELDVKTVFSSKNGLLNCYLCLYVTQIHRLFRAFFTKSVFHGSVTMSSLKLLYLKNGNGEFEKKILAQILS